MHTDLHCYTVLFIFAYIWIVWINLVYTFHLIAVNELNKFHIFIPWNIQWILQSESVTCRLAWCSWCRCYTKIPRMCSTSQGLSERRPRSCLFRGMTHNLVLRNCVSISVVSYSNVMKVSSPCVSNTHSHSHFSVYFWVVSYEGSVGSCLRVLRASVSFFPWVFFSIRP